MVQKRGRFMLMCHGHEHVDNGGFVMVRGEPSFNSLFYTKHTYLLTDYMEQSSSWSANRFSASQEIPRILWNPKVHYRIHKCLPPIPILRNIDPVHAPTSNFLKIHLNIILPSTPASSEWSLSFGFPHQNPVFTCLLLRSHQSISPGPKTSWTVRNMIRFHSEELLSPRPTPKLQIHPLSAVHDWNWIFSHIPSLLEAVPPTATWGRAMPCWQGPLITDKTLRRE